MDILLRLFENYFAMPAEHIQPLQSALGGSSRQIYRLTGASHSAIGILHDSPVENLAFLSFSRHFAQAGLPVPEIYAEDLEHGAYLEQDLGDVTLYQLLQSGRSGNGLSDEAIAAYMRTVEMLPHFQIEGAQGLDYSVCYPRAAFDQQSIDWDLNYFKYYFLKLANVPFNEQSLQHDFDRLRDFLLLAPTGYFLYRDFQSRNVMWHNEQPWFLDYQGGRQGALQYDIASLLFDAKADLPPQLRQKLLEHYLDALAQLIAVDRPAFLRHYYAFVLVRILQALGAYGFRGYYERKPHFLASVPYALKNLAWLLDNAEIPVELPALTVALRAMIRANTVATDGVHGHAASSMPQRVAPLQVKILSFSFHRGLPQDDSGHGGGFVFDARALPNPGREEKFRSLTGQDAAVAQFLDQQQDAHAFFTYAAALVDASVARYRQRGFDHLMIAFGCTGGQHRSVYLVEKLAQHLRQAPGVEVVLQHRELERMRSESAAQ